MAEWLYKKDNDKDVLNRAINIARRSIEYRNDNICNVDNRYTCYSMDFSRTVGPIWPNYKKDIEVHNGVDQLDPGAGVFGPVPIIALPVRMIADNPTIWNDEFEGKTYRDIATELSDEVLETIDYVYDALVGSDNLIRYSNLVNDNDWPGYVFIYNRVFPIISGSIPLIHAFETFGIHADKIARIDDVNNAMIDFFIADMTFYTLNGKEVVYFPYSDVAQNVKNNPSEDFTHGSLDSRDLQLIYYCGRYNFKKRHVDAIANTIIEVVHEGNGDFTENLDGTGNYSTASIIAYDGYIWYARYEPLLKEVIIDFALQNKATKNGVYDAVTIFEILKLKEERQVLNVSDNIINATKVKAYPTVFDNTINVLLDSNSEFKTIELIDIYGRVLFTEETNNRKRIELNSSSLKQSSNLYFLRLKGKTRTTTIKLVKK